MKEVQTVIYHRTDYDGLFSALIYGKYCKENEISVNYIGYTYGDNLPNIQELIVLSKRIVLLDISFPPEYMRSLIENFGEGNILWIDHHGTAINESIKFNYSSLPGIRVESFKAACELTWEYLFGSDKTPEIVKRISAFDVWDKSRFNWDLEVHPIQLSLRSTYGVNLSKLEKKINLIFDLKYLNDYLIPTGQGIKKYLTGKWRTQIKNSAFDITVAGKYKGIALLSPDFTSAMFESVLNNYQVFCICNIKNDSEYLSVSLYSEPDGRLGNFDLGEYMKENYEGGGHKTSAGGKLTKDQFIDLIFNHKI